MKANTKSFYRVFWLIPLMLSSSSGCQNSNTTTKEDTAYVLDEDTVIVYPKTQEQAAESITNYELNKPLLEVSTSYLVIEAKNFYSFRHVNSSDTTEKEEEQEVEDPGQLIDITYPFLKTPGSKTGDLINKSIQNSISRNFEKNILASPQTIRKSDDLEYQSLDEQPFVDKTEYSVSFYNPSFLCIKLFFHSYACCGASGSAHSTELFTFNLSSGKTLFLKDVIKPESLQQLRKMVAEGLVTRYEVSKEGKEVYLPKYIENIESKAFELSGEKITLWVEFSFLDRPEYLPIEIKFTEYPKLFKSDFLELVAQNK